MNDTILKRVLRRSIERELAEYDNNTSEHKFSLKHRIAMKRIFARYEKNIHKNSKKTIELSAHTMPRYRLKQKIIFALVIVILLTLLTGWFIPLYRVSQAQIDWLRSRYDFPNMKMCFALPNYAMSGSVYYFYFLSDLEELGIYTVEETYKINPLLVIYEPTDTRADSFKNEQPHFTKIEVIDKTPLDTAREIVSDLENKIEYYTERSKDKARAVKGDAEFAANIRDNYLPLHKGYLELLEKLFANRPLDDSNSKNQNNALSVLDKDSRKYLFKSTKLEKI